MNKIDRYKSLVRYMIRTKIVSSQKDLGKKMGYTNESSFSQVINNKTETPKDFTSKLKSLLPDLNERWLTDGIGEMLLSETGNVINKTQEPEETATTVLLLPVSAQGGSLNDFVVSVKDSDCEKAVSPIKGVDFAMQVSGDSMSPEYPNGSRVFIKRINERAFIEWGKAYVLDTCNGTIIKILVPSEQNGYVKCVSINQDPIYAPFEVSLQDVYGVYKVLLCMSVK